MKLVTTFVLFLLIAPTHGAIRVYNPDTGTTEAAPSLKSGDRPAVPTITTAPKTEPRRPQVQPILLPEEEEAAEFARREYAFGEVIFFVDFARYTPVVGEFIQKLENISNLKVAAYMESKDPKEYARDILRMQSSQIVSAEDDIKRMENLPKLKSDSRNQAFAYHRPGGWHKAVYYDGTGSKRVYDLQYETGKIERHINRVARQLKQQRGGR